ncbi:hypothetical protein [Streptococcus equi]|uniref:hypothetical protein n=1 Tax=Streptococcus equi TaxID=1336 RepID=UPI0022AB596E|nr:hypothetical protein [Streptococcus equi]
MGLAVSSRYICLASQEKAAAAQAAGRFVDEIVPCQYRNVKVIQSWCEKMSTLKLEQPLKINSPSSGLCPRWFRNCLLQNASGINDGAAAVLLMSRDKAEELGLPNSGAIKGMQVAGVAPEVMGTGPIPSTQKALAKVGWTVEDLDLVEANEALASQAISVSR